jgi:hypothetical protein
MMSFQAKMPSFMALTPIVSIFPAHTYIKVRDDRPPRPRAGLRGELSNLYTGIMEWRMDEARAREAPALRRAMPARNARLVTTG